MGHRGRGDDHGPGRPVGDRGRAGVAATPGRRRQRLCADLDRDRPAARPGHQHQQRPHNGHDARRHGRRRPLRRHHHGHRRRRFQHQPGRRMGRGQPGHDHGPRRPVRDPGRPGDAANSGRGHERHGRRPHLQRHGPADGPGHRPGQRPDLRDHGPLGRRPLQATITATDAPGYSGSDAIEWDVASPVTVADPGAPSAAEGGSVSLQMDATDQDFEGDALDVQRATCRPA